MNNKYQSFTVPDGKKVRVIIDTDAKNEADDQFAIVHALLTQKLDIRGINAAHFGYERSNEPMEESYQEILKVLSLMNSSVKAYRGCSKILTRERVPEKSDASALIIEEAKRDCIIPLYVLVLGPLTNVASALLQCPSIAPKMTIIWIGGNQWPHGGEEFNLKNDIEAANIVYESSVPLWQVPRPVYNSIKVSLSELQSRVFPCGKIGEYLYTQLIECNERFADNKIWPLGESWVLGDSASVALLLDPHEYCWNEYEAPAVNKEMTYVHNTGYRKIRFYNSIDVRFLLEDFYAKLELYSSKI